MVDVEVRAVFAISTAWEADKSGCLQEDPSGVDPNTAVVYDVMRALLLLGVYSHAVPVIRGRGSRFRIYNRGSRIH